MRRLVLILLPLLIVAAAGGFLWWRSTLPVRPEEEEESDRTESVAAPKKERTPVPSWPRFRGPDGSGVSDDTRVPLEWGERKNLKWKTPLPGPGSSSPIVWGERVFVTCFSGHDGERDDLKRHLVCLNRADGKIRWSKTVPAVQPEDPYRGYLAQHGYASHTPATDGERVYVFFGKSGVLAFDFEGEQLWQTGVGTGSSNRRWGSAASVVLYRDLVIVNAAEESRSLRALDRKTGQLVWKAEARSLELCFGTPLLVPVKGGQELVLAVPGEVWGLNPDTGKLLWYARTDLRGNISPSVVARGDVVFALGGYPSTRSVAVRVGGRKDVTRTHIVWTGEQSSYVPSPVVRGEHLYWVDDNGLACCVEARTGKLVHRRRLPPRGTGGGRAVYASVLLAGGRLYAVTRQGGTFVLAAKPSLDVLARNPAGDDSDFNASPAVCDGQLFLRSDKCLYCIEEMKGPDR